MSDKYVKCPASGQLHNYQHNIYEETDYTHWGGWGGFLKGHVCCGLCKSTFDGRCKKECSNQCGNPRKVKKIFVICTYCGSSPTGYTSPK